MELQELMKLYKESDYNSKGTLHKYNGVLTKFIEYFGEDALTENVFTVSELREFILIEYQGKHHTYNVINNFYHFYYSKILKYDNTKIPTFPVHIDETNKTTTKTNSNKYLPIDFNIQEFLNEAYYEHLESKETSIFIRAAISLILAGAYKAGVVVPSSSSPKEDNYLKVTDVELKDNYLLIPNFTKNDGSKIHVTGKLYDIIKEFYDIRINSNITKVGQENAFIALTENATKFKHLGKEKPYERQPIVAYMMKHICKANNIEPINVDQIRINMLYQVLHRSKGAAVHDILRLYGYEKFILDVIAEYHKNITFNFKQIAIFHLESETSEEDSHNESDLKSNLITSKFRDKKKVKELKEMYDGRCQVCGDTIKIIDNLNYSEVHHIQPLNKDNGSDEISNMLVLCPNHHKLFDLGVICINPENHNQLLHLDSTNYLNESNLNALLHDLDTLAVRYTFENIFLGTIKIEETNSIQNNF